MSYLQYFAIMVTVWVTLGMLLDDVFSFKYRIVFRTFFNFFFYSNTYTGGLISKVSLNRVSYSGTLS